VTSGSVYLTANITVGAAQSTGDYFLHLGDGGTSNFYARTYIKSSGTGFVMALGTSSGTPVTYGTTVLDFATSYTILVRYDFVAGAANDTGALFINPTTADGSGDTQYVAATTTGTDASSISSVNLRQGTSSNAPTVTINSINVAIPEPGTALLGSFGLLALLRRRR
jgi:trimeric autotransporter adhesin